MIYTVSWADTFGTTAKAFTTFLEALDWVYMLTQLGYTSFVCIEEGN